MDPRLADVLRTLLSIVMEPVQVPRVETQDPYAPPNDSEPTRYPPGSYGHFWQQLQGPSQHVTFPRPQITVTGGGTATVDNDFADLTFFG